MWLYRLSPSAVSDLSGIIELTEEPFGEPARRRYEALLTAALQDVISDPVRIGSAKRLDLGPAARTYHLRHSVERGRTAEGIVGTPRHLFLYRLVGPDLIDVGRVLHDAIDLPRHLPTDYRET